MPSKLWSVDKGLWGIYLTITVGLQYLCALIAPDYICACHRFQTEAVTVAFIPVLWGIILMFIYRNQPERVLGYASFLLAALNFYQFDKWVMG